MYKNILLIASETHSYGLDFSTRGRNVSVIFGDGAGAVVLQPNEPGDASRGILSTHLHSDGSEAELLSMVNPGFHAGRFVPEKKLSEPSQPYGGLFITKELIEKDDIYPYMDGPAVFKKAIVKFPEVIVEALSTNGYQPSDLNLLVPHQANLRIIDATASRMGLPKEKVMINIQKYGNTTAATIPLCLWEWRHQLNKGDNIVLAAFGGGFTWGATLVKWEY